MCLYTWLWMLRRFTRWRSQGRMDLRGAKVCRGGMPRLLGRMGKANTSWFSMALVMWLSTDGKLVVALSVICRRAKSDFKTVVINDCRTITASWVTSRDALVPLTWGTGSNYCVRAGGVFLILVQTDTVLITTLWCEHLNHMHRLCQHFAPVWSTG